MWYSNDTFHYMLKAKFVAPVSLKSPVGEEGRRGRRKRHFDYHTNTKLWQLCPFPDQQVEDLQA